MSCKYIEGGGYRHHTFSFPVYTFIKNGVPKKIHHSYTYLENSTKHTEIIGNVDQCICSMNAIWILEFGNQGSGISL